MTSCGRLLLEAGILYLLLKPQYDRFTAMGLDGGRAILEMLKDKNIVELIKQSNFIPDLIECLKENDDEDCNCR